MEDIAIPMLRGNMEDIAQESSTIGSESTADATLNTQQLYERESLITIDYGFLPDNLKDIDEEDTKKTNDKLNNVISELQGTIQRIQAPNMKVRIVSFFFFSLSFLNQFQPVLVHAALKKCIFFSL